MPSGLVHTGLYTRVKYIASLPRPSLRKCGSKKLISKNATGYSGGIRSSFHTFAGGGMSGGAGIYLFAALGAVPPGVPTAPTRTTRNCNARATCQPPRLPAAVLRQTWDENADPALAISCATSTMTLASTPASLAANSGRQGA